MTEERPKYTHGGARPGAGRHYLDGSLPGEGEPVVKTSISLPRWVIDYLKGLGEGSLSRGIREAARKLKEEE